MSFTTPALLSNRIKKMCKFSLRSVHHTVGHKQSVLELDLKILFMLCEMPYYHKYLKCLPFTASRKFYFSSLESVC